MYPLLMNPRWLIVLQDEIHQPNESNLSFVELAKLKVLNEMIQETFRMCPPVSTIFPHLTPSEGALAAGVWIADVDWLRFTGDCDDYAREVGTGSESARRYLGLERADVQGFLDGVVGAEDFEDLLHVTLERELENVEVYA
ncbi:hypothetical protein K458DRAFT_383425 [Lentithecium fluviatile CBS 122367]|uniref:Uncharacterized protein n=1 Tax=Lentithecium fluviatile CBS 122367 TaxID=1168545 RepID=A0A6G1JID3_9PLEO|nr:hypothetical protein K458DRAFT_383425 [Lentithecium fluviatile CBS 122367]